MTTLFVRDWLQAKSCHQREAQTRKRRSQSIAQGYHQRAKDRYYFGVTNTLTEHYPKSGLLDVLQAVSLDYALLNTLKNSARGPLDACRKHYRQVRAARDFTFPQIIGT